MGEGPVQVQRGALLWVEIRNVGWVEGSIAWVQGDRFGIAFREEIDPKIARMNVAKPVHQTPLHIRTPYDRSAGVVRKI